MNPIPLLYIGLGGFLGSVMRYVMSRTIDSKLSSTLPYGTLTVNIIGSFLLGLLYALTIRKTGIDENWKLFIGTGICGGFTTFSTFSLENFLLLQQKPLTSLFYIIVSLILGLSAVGLGVWVGKLGQD